MSLETEVGKKMGMFNQAKVLGWVGLIVATIIAITNNAWDGGEVRTQCLMLSCTAMICYAIGARNEDMMEYE